jgi:DnaK suppressor protein
MTLEEAEKYRAKLLSEIAKVEAFLPELEEGSEPETPDNAIGRVSRMDAINNKSVVENSLRENQQKLGQLKVNLSKYGAEQFGRCTRCGSEIPIARLMFMPHAMTCMRCSR